MPPAAPRQEPIRLRPGPVSSGGPGRVVASMASWSRLRHRGLERLEEADGLAAEVPVADAAHAVRHGAAGLLGEGLVVVEVDGALGGFAVVHPAGDVVLLVE